MKHLFLMDPLETIKPWKDTSYKLMLGANLEGHEIHHALFQDLFYEKENWVYSSKLTFSSKDSKKIDDLIYAEKKKRHSIDDFNYIWVRKDPPFNERYLYATLLLDLTKKAKVLNRPQAIRDWNEKLSILHFPDYSPKTYVSENYEAIKEIIETTQKRYVLKPLNGFAGKGIHFIKQDQKGWQENLKEYIEHYQAPIMVQEYLEEAKEGDKRVLLWKGEALGAILRIHPENSEINNLDAGGKAISATISKKEREIIDDIGPKLYKEGLYFVGLDFLGEKLSEINVTSPTGLQELCQFDKKDFSRFIMQSLS